MARWHVIPVLAGLLAGGAFETASAQQAEPKPGVSAPATARAAPAQRRRIARPAVQDDTNAAPVFVPPPPSSSRTIQRPSPADPYSGVTLPRQSGDAAYQGGGVVLEQDGNGVNRRVR